MASRLTSVFAVLGFLLVAGSARAQFAECLTPTSAPEEVFDTIVDEASFDFGNLSEKTCNGIVKEGVSACKAQAKAADKCYRRAFDMIYAITVKQCQEIEDSALRSECKAAAKTDRNDGKSAVNLNKEAAILICENEFAVGLSMVCLEGITM